MNPNKYIPKPCHENWNSMTGTQQKKFCDQCSCSVHNLTGMSHEQILSLKNELGGKLCGVFHVQSQSKPATELRPKTRRVHLRRSLVLTAGISSLALAACDSNKDKIEASDPTQPVERETQTQTKPQPKILLGEVVHEEKKEPVKIPVIKPEVIMGIVCPKEVKPPKQEPIIMGKIKTPKEPKK